MTILTFPTLSRAPTRVEWRLISPTQLHVSPLTGAAQTQELPGGHWAVMLEYATLLENDARLLEAWFAAMRGRAGRVAIHNMGRPNPYGVGGGTPVVNGSASGVTIPVRGAPVSTVNWLRAGDLVGLGGTVHRVLADVTTNGSGVASLTVFPVLRATAADGVAMTLVKPTIVARLLDDVQGRAYRRGGTSDMTVDLIEAL